MIFFGESVHYKLSVRLLTLYCTFYCSSPNKNHFEKAYVHRNFVLLLGICTRVHTMFQRRKCDITQESTTTLLLWIKAWRPLCYCLAWGPQHLPLVPQYTVKALTCSFHIGAWPWGPSPVKQKSCRWALALSEVIMNMDRQQTLNKLYVILHHLWCSAINTARWAICPRRLRNFKMEMCRSSQESERNVSVARAGRLSGSLPSGEDCNLLIYYDPFLWHNGHGHSQNIPIPREQPPVVNMEINQWWNRKSEPLI